MDQGLDPDEAAVVDAVHGFVERDVRPVVRELEHADVYPELLIELMKRMGVYGPAIPEPYGPFQVSTTCFALVTEELARGWMSLAGAMGGHTVVAKLLLNHGTEAQQQRYLPRMATGELRAAMALTEPGGGSDLAAIRTVAVRTATTGSSTEPRPGFKGVESCELFFDDCRVPIEALLGGVAGGGLAQMMHGLEIGRIQVAARATGVARAAFDDALRYARQRETFGQPIWQHQSVGNHLAEMATKLTAARQLLLHAARAYDAGRRADLEAAMAKGLLFGDRDGGRAQRLSHPRRERLLDRLRRRAVLPRRPLMLIGEGTNEILRTVIARQLVHRAAR